MPDPRVNLTGEPYLTDGLRLVLFLNEPRRTFQQIDFWIGSVFLPRAVAAAEPVRGNVAVCHFRT